MQAPTAKQTFTSPGPMVESSNWTDRFWLGSRTSRTTPFSMYWSAWVGLPVDELSRRSTWRRSSLSYGRARMK